jgi:hypothetical protein
VPYAHRYRTTLTFHRIDSQRRSRGIVPSVRIPDSAHEHMHVMRRNHVRHHFPAARAKTRMMRRNHVRYGFPAAHL